MFSLLNKDSKTTLTFLLLSLFNNTKCHVRIRFCWMIQKDRISTVLQNKATTLQVLIIIIRTNEDRISTVLQIIATILQSFDHHISNNLVNVKFATVQFLTADIFQMYNWALCRKWWPMYTLPMYSECIYFHYIPFYSIFSNYHRLQSWSLSLMCDLFSNNVNKCNYYIPCRPISLSI